MPTRASAADQGVRPTMRALLIPAGVHARRARLLIRTLIIRESRPMRLRRRILLQLLHRDGHRALQLRIVAGMHRFRIHLHLHIRRHAVVLHVPLAARTKESEIGRRNRASIHQRRYCETPINPPQVRLPTSVPTCVWRNIQGIMSPPDPAISLVIITLGPKIAAAGVR